MKNHGIRSCIIEEPYISAATPSRISLLSRNSETLHRSAFQCSAGVRNPQMVQNVRIPKMQSLLLCMLYFIKMYSRSTFRWNRWRVVKKYAPAISDALILGKNRHASLWANALCKHAPISCNVRCNTNFGAACDHKKRFPKRVHLNMSRRPRWTAKLWKIFTVVTRDYARLRRRRNVLQSHHLYTFQICFSRTAADMRLRPRSSSVNCSRSRSRPKGAEHWVFIAPQRMKIVWHKTATSLQPPP